MASTTPNTATIGAPRHLPPRVLADWEHLGSRTMSTRGAVGSGPGQQVNPADLPAPVRRWFEHSVGKGGQPCLGARISMHGEIKVGKWRPFTAQQVLSPNGFVWAAVAGRFPMRILGFDRCSGGTGEMRWKLAGIVPVMSASDDDTYRSAAGRLAGEMMLLPGAVIGEHVRWTDCTDGAGSSSSSRCTASVTTGPFTRRVTVGIDSDGVLESVVLPRWGNPDGEAHREHTFGVEMEGDQRMGGYRVPRDMRAGWWFGTPRWAEGEFFRATIDTMEFF